jgi:hypothetical protein
VSCTGVSNICKRVEATALDDAPHATNGSGLDLTQVAMLLG